MKCLPLAATGADFEYFRLDRSLKVTSMSSPKAMCDLFME